MQVNVGPVIATAASQQQPPGLVPLAAAQVSNGSCVFNAANNGPNLNLLPAMTTLWRNSAQPYNDGAGDPNANGVNHFYTNTSPLWSTLSWEDDLIMTGVRSFDIKAYDNALAGYGDLGWGDDLRLYIPYSNYGAANIYSKNNPAIPTTPPALAQTPATLAWPPLSPGGNFYSTINQTFAHEGRMPPLIEDNRLDYQNPNPNYVSFNNFIPQYSAFPNYSSNIGDDNNGIVRLRRVWDSWSTEYSKAPSSGVYQDGSPAGPLTGTPPIYPSYPPPYPAPLRGIQIQIRVVDPTNQRVKSMTIRQDFTDKL